MFYTNPLLQGGILDESGCGFEYRNIIEISRFCKKNLPVGTRAGGAIIPRVDYAR